MSTTTAPQASLLPGVSPETEAKSRAAAVSFKIGKLIGAISAKYNSMDEVHKRIAGSVLLSKTGLKMDSKDRDFRVVLGALLSKYPHEADNIEKFSVSIIDAITTDTTGSFETLVEMMDSTPAKVYTPVPAKSEPLFPTSVILPGSPGSTAPVPEQPAPEVETKTKRKRSSPAASSVEIEPIAVKGPEVVPTVANNPTDPMSGLVSAVAQALTPVIVAIASNQARAEIASAVTNPFGSVVNALKDVESKAKAASSVTASVDAESVRKIVTDEMSTTAGKGVHALIESEGSSILTKLLDKAADAVASSGPKHDPSASSLKALVPDSDPNYHWAPDLVEVADLIQKAAATSPQNTLIVGPTGAGKTDFAEQFAAKYGRKFVKMDCANLREPREWFGIKGASGGATYFKKSQFWHAVAEGGCVILLDEFNRAPDSIRNPLMPLLDHTRKSYVDEVGETLVVGKGTVFFATQNEGLEYTGTHATDRAMKSRFVRRVEIDYLNETEEALVLANKTGIKPDDAKKLVEIARTIRTKASSLSGGLSDTVSTRQIIHAASDFVLSGPRTFKHSVFSHFSVDGGTNSDRAQVVNMFQLKGFKI